MTYTLLLPHFYLRVLNVRDSLKAPEVRAVKQRKRRMDAYAYAQYKITVKDTEGSSLPQLQHNYYDLDTVSQSQLSPLTVFSL